MNNLITTYTGGQELIINDYKFIQEALKEAIALLAKSTNTYSTTAFKVYGLNWTVTDSGGLNPVLHLPEGAIFYNDEIYKVEATIINLPTGVTETYVTDNYEWDLDISYDSDGDKVFEDTTPHQVYQIRQAVFTETPTTWTGIKNLASTIEALTYIQKKIFTIGNWDMHTDTYKDIVCDIDHTKILNAYCVVYNDDLSRTFMLSSPHVSETDPSGIRWIESGLIKLYAGVGYFNGIGNGFEGTTINRGYIVIEYV